VSEWRVSAEPVTYIYNYINLIYGAN